MLKIEKRCLRKEKKKESKIEKKKKMQITPERRAREEPKEENPLGLMEQLIGADTTSSRMWPI